MVKPHKPNWFHWDNLKDASKNSCREPSDIPCNRSRSSRNPLSSCMWDWLGLKKKGLWVPYWRQSWSELRLTFVVWMSEKHFAWTIDVENAVFPNRSSQMFVIKLFYHIHKLNAWHGRVKLGDYFELVLFLFFVEFRFFFLQLSRTI